MHAKTKRLESFEWLEKIERFLWRAVDAAGQLATRVDLGSNCVGFGVMIEPNG